MPETLDQPTTLEGTWEEVVQEAGDLAGKRVSLTIYPAATGEAVRTLADLLAPLLEQADRLEAAPPVPPMDAHEAALDEMMRAKATRLGLKI